MEREVTSSILGHDIPKSVKIVLAAPRLVHRLTGQSYDWSTQCQDNVTGCGITASFWGMIIQ